LTSFTVSLILKSLCRLDRKNGEEGYILEKAVLGRIEKLRGAFRDDREFSLYILAGSFIGVASGIYNTVFNNYLSDTYHLTSGIRGALEFPREMPGMLIMLVLGVLVFLGDTRLASLAMGASTMGLIGLGLLDSFASLGGILGTFAAGFAGEMKQRSAFTMASLAVNGVLIASLGLVHHLWLALVVAVLSGFCSPFFNINSAIIYQSLVPDKLRGRVFTVRLLLGQGATPLGAFLGGITAQIWGLPPLFIISGLASTAMAALAYLQPALRRIDGDLVPIQE
jgi:MFS family permease